MAEDVNTLRAFRDQHLLKTELGKALVELYYEHSPTVAETIADKPALRAIVRALLKPVVWFGRRMVVEANAE